MAIQQRLAIPPVPPTEEEQLAEAVRLGIEHMLWKASQSEGADPEISAAVIRRRLAVCGWPLLDHQTLRRRLKGSLEFGRLLTEGKLRRARLLAERNRRWAELRRARRRGPKVTQPKRRRAGK